MPTTYRKQDFFETAEGEALLKKLQEMHESELYLTDSSYSPKSEIYSNNLIPFIDKHVNYIRTHPQMNPLQYISNLQISTRVR